MIYSAHLLPRLEEQVKSKISRLQIKPKMVYIIIGGEMEVLSQLPFYRQKASQLGVEFDYIHFPQTELFENVALTILKLNQDSTVHGIAIRLPLPAVFLGERSVEDLVLRIDPAKDIDGLSGKSDFKPSVVITVLKLMEGLGKLNSQFIVVIGNDRFIAKPLVTQLRQKGLLVANIDPSEEKVKKTVQKADVLILSGGVNLPSTLFPPESLVIETDKLKDEPIISLLSNVSDAAMRLSNRE